jgi:hypothetical protein
MQQVIGGTIWHADRTALDARVQGETGALAVASRTGGVDALTATLAGARGTAPLSPLVGGTRATVAFQEGSPGTITGTGAVGTTTSSKSTVVTGVHSRITLTTALGQSDATDVTANGVLAVVAVEAGGGTIPANVTSARIQDADLHPPA